MYTIPDYVFLYMHVRKKINPPVCATRQENSTCMTVVLPGDCDLMGGLVLDACQYIAGPTVAQLEDFFSTDYL